MRGHAKVWANQSQRQSSSKSKVHVSNFWS